MVDREVGTPRLAGDIEMGPKQEEGTGVVHQAGVSKCQSPGVGKILTFSVTEKEVREVAGWMGLGGEGRERARRVRQPMEETGFYCKCDGKL